MQSQNQILASERLKDILRHDIKSIVSLCKRTTFAELSCFLHWLHLGRISNRDVICNDHELEIGLTRMTTSLQDESLKYLIQCVAKYGTLGLLTKDNYRAVNTDLAYLLLKRTDKLNTKFLAQGHIGMYEVDVVDDKVGFDLSKPVIGDVAVKLQDYFVRNELNNEFKKISESYLDLDGLFSEFFKNHQNNDDLIYEAFGVSLNTYLDFHRFIADYFLNNLRAIEELFPRVEDGRIDVNSVESLYLYTFATYIRRADIKEKFGKAIAPLLRKLTFEPSAFDEFQLRYHKIARTPLIILPDSYFQLCPDLIFDSLFLNTHYTILESEKSKEKYKARSAEIFLDRIAEICLKVGFNEVDRNLQLQDCNRDLGDIDLILRKGDEFLLIEAKNHALPLDVYFVDIEAVEKHLDYLRKRWERLVRNRIEHIKNNPEKYYFGDNFSYLVVSRTPEVISHFSRFIFLSIQELQPWLENKFSCFEELYQFIYGREKINLSEDEWEILENQGFGLQSYTAQPQNVADDGDSAG